MQRNAILYHNLGTVPVVEPDKCLNPWLKPVQASVQEAPARISGLVVYTDGSYDKSQWRGTAACYIPGREPTWQQVQVADSSTTVELWAIVLALEQVQDASAQQVHIITDSQAAIGALAHSHRCQRLSALVLKVVRQIHTSSKTVHVWWVPAHTLDRELQLATEAQELEEWYGGDHRKGNHIADVTAYNAMSSQPQGRRDAHKISIRTLKRMAKADLRQKWRLRYKQYSGRYSLVHPTLPEGSLIKTKDRAEASVIFRLKTGHNNLRRHRRRKNMKPGSVPICRWCSEPVEEEKEDHIMNHHGKCLPQDFPRCLQDTRRKDVRQLIRIFKAAKI